MVDSIPLFPSVLHLFVLPTVPDAYLESGCPLEVGVGT